MLPAQTVSFGVRLLAHAFQSLFGGSARAGGIRYTLYAVIPHRMADFLAERGPACSVASFCDLLRERRYEESKVMEFLRQARDLERQNPGDVVMVAGVREE